MDLDENDWASPAGKPLRSAEANAPALPRGLAELAYVNEYNDEDGFDGAKTQKLVRRRSPSTSDGIDDEDSGVSDRPSQPPRQRKKRPMVKIPDDSVPVMKVSDESATPAPAKASPVSLGSPTGARQDSVKPPPTAPTPGSPTGPPLSGPPGSLKAPPRPPPSAPAGPLPRRDAVMGSQLAAEGAGEADVTPDDDDLGGGDRSSMGFDEVETTPAEGVAAKPKVADARAASDDEDLEEVEELEDEATAEMRPSGPGIFADVSTISVLRAVQIVSDLPAVASLRESEGHEGDPDGPDTPQLPQTIDLTPVSSGRRPPPPRRDRVSDIEEIEPERMSLPDDPRRPPPPPRADQSGRHPAIAADASGPVPIVSDALANAEAVLALAEARAREAEVRAQQAEAKAREAAAKAESARGAKKPWWVEVFEDDLVRTLDNPRKKDVAKDADFIEKSLRLDKGSRILDLACGTGVHAVELASRGYQLVGVDYSHTMLKLAEKYNQQRGMSVSFIHGDMRQLNLEGIFDGIYCWASSFGYFDDAANAQVLERIARALRPGGMFALDIDNRDYIAPRSPSMAWFEKPGAVCMDEMRFDFYASRMFTKRMVLFDTGRSREVEIAIRLYTLHELGRLLHKAGFKVVEVSGHRAHRGAYFGAESPRIIVTGQRRED